nr:unnamed protein product [Callosobruchus chinensis]
MYVKPLFPWRIGRPLDSNGAIWNGAPEDPVLQNADEIMPAEYSSADLSVDSNEQNRGGKFILQADQLTLTYINPIPGAIWNGAPEDPVLQNADEIMPAEYSSANLSDDSNDIHTKLVFMNKKAPKYFTAPISYETNTNKEILRNWNSHSFHSYELSSLSKCNVVNESMLSFDDTLLRTFANLPKLYSSSGEEDGNETLRLLFSKHSMEESPLEEFPLRIDVGVVLGKEFWSFVPVESSVS